MKRYFPIENRSYLAIGDPYIVFFKLLKDYCDIK